MQEFTKVAESVWDEIDHSNLKVAFHLKMGHVTAVPLRSDTFFSDAVFSVAGAETRVSLHPSSSPSRSLKRGRDTRAGRGNGHSVWAVYAPLGLRNENERVAGSVSHADQEAEPTTTTAPSGGSRRFSTPSNT